MTLIGHYAMLACCIGTVIDWKCDNEAKPPFFPKVCFFLSLLDDAHVCRANPLAETFTLHKLTLSNTSFSRSCPLLPQTLQSSQRGSRFQVSCCCCMLLYAGTNTRKSQQIGALAASFPLLHKPALVFPLPLLTSVSHICLFVKLRQVVLW